MSKSNAMENGMLLLFFNNTDFANIGDAGGLQNSAAAGSFYVSLHTADPGEAGTQATSEATYTGYARVAVARSAGGWTVATNTVTNTAAITFGPCTAGSNTILYWGVGTDLAGAGTLLYSNTLSVSNQGPFTAIAAGDLITIPGHTLAVSDRVAFFAAYGSTLPGGITEGTQYFVKTVASNDITISTTDGGATLDITSAGDGVCYKASALAVSAGITPSFPTNNLIITED